MKILTFLAFSILASPLFAKDWEKEISAMEAKAEKAEHA